MAIAVLCSGGDCAGMNPAVKKFVDYSFDLGLEPYLIYDGLEGLIDNSIQKATHEAVAGIMHEGGTILRSSRSKRFFDKNYRQKAYENLKAKGIDKLVVLGGDGSFRALDIFSKEFDLSFMGIPSTIDNDIFGTQYCLGVDTALNVIRRATDELRDTSASFKRGCVVETMGRDCGYLALVSAITCGAEVCIIPEAPYDLDALAKRLKDEITNGRRYVIAVVAEGVKVTQEVKEWLENEIGIESRATILGHIQRGGNPTVFDRLMATEFTAYAIDKLVQEAFVQKVVVYNDAKFDYKDIDTVTSRKYTVKPELIAMAQKMFGT